MKNSKSLRTVLALIILSLFLTKAMAQDFRLFISPSAMDLSASQKKNALDNITDWQEVTQGGLYGNNVEVDRFVSKMRSPGLKGLEEAEQFQRMRNHSILAFRIDDDGRTLSYTVTAKQGEAIKSFTTTKGFFINVPMSDDYLELTVSQVKDPNQKISILCQSKPFGNDSIYLFQLDKACQDRTDEFNLEVLMNDSTVENYKLLNKKFQCLFTSPSHYPVEAYLSAGGNKLQLDVSQWKTGVGLLDVFDKILFKKVCSFSSHSAEFSSFNWIGAGLFANYDTLYLQVRDLEDKIVNNVTVNVQAVDDDGKPVKDRDAHYLKYDSNTLEHQILTYGKPALLEILADGYLPMLYEYKGSADPETHVLSMTGISDFVRLSPGKVDMDKVAFFKKQLDYVVKKDYYANLHDSLWSAYIEEVNLMNYPVTATVTYSPNGATDQKKLARGMIFDNYARLSLYYSVPKDYVLGDVGEVSLDFKDSKEKGKASHISDEIISARDYPGLSHSYVKSNYDLSDCVPKGETIALTYTNGDVVDTDFPLLYNFAWTQRDIMTDMNDNTPAPTDQVDREDPADIFGKDVDFAIPINLNFNVKGVGSLKTSVKVNYKDGEIVWKMAFVANDNKFDKFDDAEKNNKVINSYKSFKYQDNQEKETSLSGNFNSGVVDTDKDVNEIFGQAMMSGAGPRVSLYASGKIPLQNWKKNFSSNFWDIIEEVGGSLGYGATFGMTSLGGFLRDMDVPSIMANAIDIIRDYVRFGFKFDAYVGANFGLETYLDSASDRSDGRGFFVEALAYAIIAAWLEVGTPPNPVCNIQAGIRGGGKLGVSGKYTRALDNSHYDNEGYGLKITYLALLQLYAFIDTFLGGYHGSFDLINLGGTRLVPNNNSNPYHKDFPKWLKENMKTRANAFRALHADVDPEMGKVVYEGVAADAAPNYIGEGSIVLNHLYDNTVYDDDGIVVVDLSTKQDNKISNDKLLAVKHDLATAGDHKMIVYEQNTLPINPESVTDDNVNQRTQEVSEHFNIHASFAQQDGSWTDQMVCQNGKANLNPVGAIQDNGHAAVIWQSGVFSGNTRQVSDDSLAVSSVMVGDLLYSRYDGNTWSQPISLVQINADKTANNYQAIMRDDTLLVALHVTDYPNDSVRRHTSMKYISITPDGKVNVAEEPLLANSFSLKKVGNYNLIALIHQTDTTKSDVFMKSLRMDGSNEGSGGTDLGLEERAPIKAKIIPLKNAEGINDFVLMWMENNHHGRDEDGNKTNLNGYRRVLNAARVNLNGNMRIATPIMLGADKDSLTMMDFDGFFDNDQVKAIYLLTDQSLLGGSVVVENQKEFRNNFNYVLTYDPMGVTDGIYVPLKLTVNNTGASAINHVFLNLNGVDFDMDDGFVAPFDSRDFFVTYQMEEGFNGFINSRVEVEYENVLKAPKNKMRLKGSKVRTLSINNVKTQLRVISQSVDDEGNNTFLVEIINHSKITLRYDQSLFVGVYSNPRYLPLKSSPSTEGLISEYKIIPIDEFRDYGGWQRIITTVTVPSVSNDIDAYIVAQIIDNGTNLMAGVNGIPENQIYQEDDNCNNYYTVQLKKKGTPTFIDGVRQDLRAERQMDGERISVTFKENGLLVSRLNDGETVRLYDINGMEYFVEKAKGSELFIPVNKHSYFVVKTNDDSVKFLF